jgi:hypothetical protein
MYGIARALGFCHGYMRADGKNDGADRGREIAFASDPHHRFARGRQTTDSGRAPDVPPVRAAADDPRARTRFALRLQSKVLKNSQIWAPALLGTMQ